MKFRNQQPDELDRAEAASASAVRAAQERKLRAERLAARNAARAVAASMPPVPGLKSRQPFTFWRWGAVALALILVSGAAYLWYVDRAVSTFLWKEDDVSVPEYMAQGEPLVLDLSYELGAYESALAVTVAESSVQPELVEGRDWLVQAIQARERNDHAAAVRLLGEARARSPELPQIYLNLGYSQDALGRFAQAEHNYRTFLALTADTKAFAAQRKSVQERLSSSVL